MQEPVSDRISLWPVSFATQLGQCRRRWDIFAQLGVAHLACMYDTGMLLYECLGSLSTQPTVFLSTGATGFLVAVDLELVSPGNHRWLLTSPGPVLRGRHALGLRLC